MTTLVILWGQVISPPTQYPHQKRETRCAPRQHIVGQQWGSPLRYPADSFHRQFERLKYLGRRRDSEGFCAMVIGKCSTVMCRGMSVAVRSWFTLFLLPSVTRAGPQQHPQQEHQHVQFLRVRNDPAPIQIAPNGFAAMRRVPAKGFGLRRAS